MIGDPLDGADGYLEFSADEPIRLARVPAYWFGRWFAFGKMRRRAGYWTIDDDDRFGGPWPPTHPNCRCVLEPLS